jgi:hypothetical protein
VPEADQPNPVVLGVVSAPGAATELAQRLRAQLAEHIPVCLPGVDRSIRFVSDRLVDRPAELSQLIAVARRRLIDEAVSSPSASPTCRCRPRAAQSSRARARRTVWRYCRCPPSARSA